MSETNYMSRGSNCNSGNYRRVPGAIAPSDFSFEVCSAACIADVYCIGIETHADHASDIGTYLYWDNCMMIFEDSFEDCPDGDGTFWPKDCQCPPALTPRPTEFSFFFPCADDDVNIFACSDDDADDDDDDWQTDDDPDSGFDFFGSDAAAARGPLLVVFIGAVAAALAH